MMRYAEVSVNSPAAQRRTFSYSIPSDLNVIEGQAVWIPFGDRLLQGVVLALTDTPAVELTKDIEGIIDPAPVLSKEQINLAYWISRYYLAPLFSAVSLMLPPGYDRKPVTFISLFLPEDFDPAVLTPDQNSLIEILRVDGRTSLKNLEKELGQRKAQRLVSNLVKRELLKREYEMEPEKARPKVESRVTLAGNPQSVRATIEEFKTDKRLASQVSLLEFLLEYSEPVSIPDLVRLAEVSRSTVTTLIKKGLIVREETEVMRDPLAEHPVNISYPLTLTASQEKVFTVIKDAVSLDDSGESSIFLLHGVTGSGKTEVYLQSLAEVINRGKTGIVLVPEIALTPQTIERFASRFPGKIAVLHSQLSLGERFDEWRRIRRGEVDVVIGPRSALFAPVDNLGLIILDEEHEWTYKQQDTPRYNARDVAVKLAGLKGATVILGSATPDIGSYYKTVNGEYQLLELPERVTPWENAPLPEVEVVDLRAELKSGNRSMFSRSLTAAIKTALAGNEQVMLFLNRRGAATYIQCRDCGFVLKCRRCDIPLTYHMDEEMLVCHRCNYRTRLPEVCPECGSRRIRYLGTGTQKLEQEALATFPGARILRWDSDTTGRKHTHRELLTKFRDHQADILIGTQMITKGLDLPLVTLVGVVFADTALNLPDFRSGERTFQLLTQVAGRAGRGPNGGRVIIQTYSPEHYAIQAASHHDYHALYEKETGYRKEFGYPPYSQLAGLTFAHRNDKACQKEADRLKVMLTAEINTRGISGVSIIGPAPAFMHRLRGRYRWQLILKGEGLPDFLADVPVPQGWTIDIDPVGL